jgi:hypothetical protein
MFRMKACMAAPLSSRPSALWRMAMISQEKLMTGFALDLADQAPPLRRKGRRLSAIVSAARLLATTGLVVLLIGLGWILATGDEAALTRLIGMV